MSQSESKIVTVARVGEHMRRVAAVLLTMVFVVFAVQSSAAIVPATKLSESMSDDRASDAERVIFLMRSAQDSIATGQFEDGREQLLEILALKTFDEMPPTLRATLYSLLASVEVRLDLAEEAMEHLRMSSSVLPEGRDYTYWSAMMSAAWRMNDDALIVEAATHIAREYPVAVQEWSKDRLLIVVRSALSLPIGNVGRAGFLETLWDMPYEPSDGYDMGEFAWLGLVLDHLALHQDDKARAVAQTLGEAQSIMAMAIDGRMAALAPANPEAAFIAAQSSDLAEALALAAAYPRDLKAIHRRYGAARRTTGAGGLGRS